MQKDITIVVIEQQQDGVFVEVDETLMKSFTPRMLGLTDEPFRIIDSNNKRYSTTELRRIFWNLLKEHCDEQKEKEDENEDESIVMNKNKRKRKHCDEDKSEDESENQ
jgi:hypothetical protein